ncbi:MAG: protein-export chaperone SecB [Pseudomonadota bacterium]
MSDETSQADDAEAPAAPESAPGADANAGVDPNQPPALAIVAHYIRDLSFENVAAQEATQPQGQPEINVTVNLDAAGGPENRYQVSMKINATAKSGDQTRFLVELDYIGIFNITNVKQEHVHPLLFIECPRQLLPYARRVVSDVTRDGGYPPLMLDNVDFANLYRQKLEQLRAEQAQAAETEGNA